MNGTPARMLLKAQSSAVFLVLVVGSVAKPQSPGMPSIEERRKALNAVFQEAWEYSLKQAPEFASTIGDKRYNDKLADRSVEAFDKALAFERTIRLQLNSIDTTGFTDQEKISRELFLVDVAFDQESAEFKEWEMPINQMGGVYADFPQLVEQLSFARVKDYDDWIARLRAMPTAFDQVSRNIAIGIDDHRVPPKYLLEKTLQQVTQLANQKPDDSPLAMPLKNFPPSIPKAEQKRIQTEMLSVIAEQVLPAYARFAQFIKERYIPAGRTEPGISALPDGDKYYQFLIWRTTTTHLTAERIHRIGLDEVKKDEAEMLLIAQKLGFKDLASFRASLKDNPKLKAISADALLDAYRGYLTPMQARLPSLFGRLPKAPFEVLAVPDYLEKNSAPAYYELGTPDGIRPGRLRINTYNATDRNLDTVESIAYHEGLPGHHMQFAISQELTGLPEFRKYEGYGSFTEGWALYAEQLGKDIGLYQNPYSDYGRLEDDIWRAIRLVVDTGVHSQHWTRQQMVDFFHEHSAIDETSIQAEVDRYIAWPSQALAYKIGQMKILELRDNAQKRLGQKFDIRAFHDQVIDSGALPLGVLEGRINAWIANPASSAPRN